ncbi:hypothetical protein [Streptomyces sp. NPDC058620]|uniref:hypothetical protein n=1 Tax=Streptomyces sp. NPDC058620 TaxID=3346560 RepID=UPI003667D643
MPPRPPGLKGGHGFLVGDWISNTFGGTVADSSKFGTAVSGNPGANRPTPCPGGQDETGTTGAFPAAPSA